MPLHMAPSFLSSTLISELDPCKVGRICLEKQANAITSQEDEEGWVWRPFWCPFRRGRLASGDSDGHEARAHGGTESERKMKMDQLDSTEEKYDHFRSFCGEVALWSRDFP